MSAPSPFDVGRSIGQNVSGAFKEQRDRSALDDILSQAMNAEDPESHNDVIRQIIMRVSPERRPEALQFVQARQQQLQSQQMRQRQQQALQSQGIDPSVANLEPSVQKEFIKSRGKQQQESAGQDATQRAFTRLRELHKKGKVGFGSTITPAFMGEEQAQDVGEFNSLSGALEAALVDKVSRGTLSNARFKYITETLLPKPGDRLKTIEGKLKGLADVLGLKMEDLPEIEQKQKSKERQKPKLSLKDIFK